MVKIIKSVAIVTSVVSLVASTPPEPFSGPTVFLPHEPDPLEAFASAGIPSTGLTVGAATEPAKTSAKPSTKGISIGGAGESVNPSTGRLPTSLVGPTHKHKKIRAGVTAGTSMGMAVTVVTGAASNIPASALSHLLPTLSIETTKTG